ncbi:MAG: LptF/LptG family permease [Elusimicrobia bacterium]|nr:LptF/LptG family permease [Elusimicrobiota bacterium]
MKIIDRYIIKEFLPKFLTSLSVFTLILLMDQIFDFLADLVLNKGVNFLDTLKLFLYLLSSLFMFSVPISIFSGSVLLFSRMNEDNEITAIRTAGIATTSIIKPVAVISFLLSLLMFHVNSTLAPQANSKFKKLYYPILYKNPVTQFSEKNFIQIQNYDIYVKKIQKDNTLKGVLIYKWEEGLPTITTAKSAEMVIAEEKGFLFRLNNGMTFQENSKRIGDFSVCNFLTNEMVLAVNNNTDFLANREVSIRELKSKDLLKKLKTVAPELKNLYITEFHLRIALACAGFILIFVSIPLSLLYKKRAKSFGITSIIAIIFAYYTLLIAGTTMGQKGFINPVAAVWFPNFTFGIIGALLTLKLIKK